MAEGSAAGQTAHRIALGAWLAEERTRAGMSQAQLAALAGMSQAALSKTEAGRARLEVYRLTRLAVALRTGAPEALDAASRLRDGRLLAAARPVRGARRAVDPLPGGAG